MNLDESEVEADPFEPWHPGPDHPGHARTRVHSNPDLQVENFHLGLYPNYTMRSDK